MRPLVVISIVPQVRKDFNYSLKVSDIRKWEIDHGTIPAGSVVFVRSDWSKRWPSPELPKLKKFPGVSLEALEFLHHQRHILFHGHEPLDTDSTPTLEGESWLMHHGYAQAEGVANLDKVPATGCLVDIGYPKFGGGVGGYARFVAICPPGSPHGVRIGQVPEAPMRKYALAAALERRERRCACARTPRTLCPRLGAMRVRFAPSPTGQLHIGGARTALYNWLVARGQGGTMVLRIEDTDRERSTPENVEQILDALRWLEIDYDEGPISQVSRSDRHQEVLQRLLDSGHAYRSTATADDVKAFKAQHGADRGFRGEAQADGAVRLRVPDDGETVVHDLIRGDTTFQHVHMDDPVIARADGSVLYNFAVAVDDLDSEITHVIRGEDHLSNTPKQLLVLEALGAEPPVYAHLPLLHGPDGKKLSKRHGAASVQELREAGYLPEAVRNYIALLGWGDADDETLISTDELVKRFRIERVSRNPAQFDEQKLRWMNGRYMRELGTDEITRRLEELTGRSRPARRGRHLGGEDPDPGGLLAAGGLHLRRPLRRPRGAREVARRRRARRPGRRARGPRGHRAVRHRAHRAGPARRGRAARRQGRRTSSSRCASHWPEPRSHRASSRPSRSSVATRRCRASTPPCGPEKLPEIKRDRARAQTPVHTCR